MLPLSPNAIDLKARRSDSCDLDLRRIRRTRASSASRPPQKNNMTAQAMTPPPPPDGSAKATVRFAEGGPGANEAFFE